MCPSVGLLPSVASGRMVAFCWVWHIVKWWHAGEYGLNPNSGILPCGLWLNGGVLLNVALSWMWPQAEWWHTTKCGLGSNGDLIIFLSFGEARGSVISNFNFLIFRIPPTCSCSFWQLSVCTTAWSDMDVSDWSSWRFWVLYKAFFWWWSTRVQACVSLIRRV